MRLVWVVTLLIFLGIIGIQESYSDSLYPVNSTEGSYLLSGINPITSDGDDVYAIAYLDNKLVIIDISDPINLILSDLFFDDAARTEFLSKIIKYKNYESVSTTDSDSSITISNFRMINSDGNSLNVMSKDENSILLINLHNNRNHPQEFIVKFFWESHDRKDPITIMARAFTIPYYFLVGADSQIDIGETYDFVIEVWDKDEVSQIAEPFVYSITVSTYPVPETSNKSFQSGNHKFSSTFSFVILLFNIVMLAVIPFLFFIVYFVRRHNDPKTPKTFLNIGIIATIITIFVIFIMRFGGGPL